MVEYYDSGRDEDLTLNPSSTRRSKRRVAYRCLSCSQSDSDGDVDATLRSSSTRRLRPASTRSSSSERRPASTVSTSKLSRPASVRTIYGRDRRDSSGDPSDVSEDEKPHSKRNPDRQSSNRKHCQQSSSDEERRNRVQPMATLKRYDGTTSVESFLSQFKAWARYCNWGYEDKSL